MHIKCVLYHRAENESFVCIGLLPEKKQCDPARRIASKQENKQLYVQLRLYLYRKLINAFILFYYVGNVLKIREYIENIIFVLLMLHFHSLLNDIIALSRFDSEV